MSIEDKIKLALAEEKKAIVEMSDMVKLVRVVMDLIKDYSGKAVEISLPRQNYSLVISDKSLGLKEPMGFIRELLMPNQKTDANIGKGIREVVNEDQLVKTILAIAIIGQANIKVIDIEG